MRGCASEGNVWGLRCPKGSGSLRAFGEDRLHYHLTGMRGMAESLQGESPITILTKAIFPRVKVRDGASRGVVVATHVTGGRASRWDEQAVPSVCERRGESLRVSV